MNSLKPITEMPGDVREGDLVRVALENSDYVGYRWNLNSERVIGQLIFTDDSDILLCGLNPYGTTGIAEDKSKLLSKIQFVGVNLEKGTLGNETVKGYQVIIRSTHSEE